MKVHRKKGRGYIFRPINIIIPLCAFVLTCTALVLWGVFLSPGDEMAYSIMAFYLIMPLMSFVCTYLVSRSGLFYSVAFIVLASFMGVLIPAIVFHRSWGVLSLLFGLVPSIAGFGVAQFINQREKKKTVINFSVSKSGSVK